MSTNSCSTSITSTRSNSVWRRIVYFILPHLDDEEEIQEMIRRTSIDVSTEVGDLHPMSGALLNDEHCQNHTTWPLCTAKSYNQSIKKRVILTNKPLPPLPDAAAAGVEAKRSVRFLDIRPEVEAFIREVDASFLSPSGRKVLEHLNRLSEPSQGSSKKIVKLGYTCVSIPLDDTNRLSELREITANMHVEHKRRLLDDLVHLVKPECRDLLRQIMLDGVQMGDSETVMKMSDHEGDPFEDAPVPVDDEASEELREILTPAPLRVKWKGAQDAMPRARRLSPVAKYSNAPSNTHVSQSTDEPMPLKCPGTVRAACLAAEARLAGGASSPGSKYGPLRSTPSTPSLRSARMWQSALATIPSDEDFVNPRQAPSPPLSLAQEEPGDAVPELLVPSNVDGAGVAAVARSSTETSDGSPRPSISSSTADGSRKAVRHLPTEKLKGEGRARSLIRR